jgi:hypothetical protein
VACAYNGGKSKTAACMKQTAFTSAVSAVAKSKIKACKKKYTFEASALCMRKHENKARSMAALLIISKIINLKIYLNIALFK